MEEEQGRNNHHMPHQQIMNKNYCNYISLAMTKMMTINADWYIEQDLTSHQTHFRSYRGQVFMGQMTQPTVSKHWRKIGSKD